ncbi:hypothetical protein PN838_20045 [Psychrosphaera sp. G1-22]|uniref:Uncharacterized protein n=1 Tax=Psychrosphaera algicola TaxID=3023714 RepID=A0ABT5FHE7_9GAMM|nr:hypothetical protein [Psychrosphaera sp. G1-22]MDC2890613.1 hypothetical protein [Psychrosphaera sp. G1-22]
MTDEGRIFSSVLRQTKMLLLALWLKPSVQELVKPNLEFVDLGFHTGEIGALEMNQLTLLR